MNVEQRAVRFSCQDSTLFGIFSVPERTASRGVLIVVGGPQYRVGSHRQFALLARFLASHGIPVMRFDYRGMGDSEGDGRTFEDIDVDIRQAIDQFQAHVEGLREVVIWGLCDAASAAMFYAHSDHRVAGLVLLNPWIRTEQGVAKAYLKHYYTRQLLSRQFWSKVLRFRMDIGDSAKSFFRMTASMLRPAGIVSPTPGGAASAASVAHDEPLPHRMLSGLRQFRGPVLFILSGNDLTAKEFLDTTGASREWRTLLGSPRMQFRHLPEANHTFASRAWRDQVAEWTKDWMGSW